ncbi:MAG: phosphate/phosphite/phosphonate ABC transporter substrate-binding protein [Candidatus Krumholzibacteriota bacterium]|nr:phosphate/phosphite/phosphonate ABC transporter substrate-binding protein [Candidatus Krumholzibacteriota bacterium]
MIARSFLPFLFAIACLLPAGAAGAQEGTPDKPVRIGFNGGDSPGIIRLKGSAFTAFLEERSGVSCAPVVTESLSQLIRALAESRVDFAFLSPLGFITAEQVADVQVLLKSVRGGQPNYWSVILVRRDSGIDALDDLKGRRFAFTHLASTSGYVIPMSRLLAEGITPEEYFSEVLYAGGHSAVIRMILDGTVDAGATFADDPEGKVGAWTAAEFLDPAEGRKLKPIYFSDPIPGDTFTARRALVEAQPRLVAHVVAKLLEMGESRTGQTILNDLYNIDSLAEAESADYDPVRNAFQLVRNR